MKKKILYHLLRKSDYIYALTYGNSRNSQLLAVINELKLQHIEFDEINCVTEMDGESYDEIIEGANTLSANRKDKKRFSAIKDIQSKKMKDRIPDSLIADSQSKEKSEKSKEEEYHTQTTPDGLEFVGSEYSMKRNIEELINLTEKFFISKLTNIKKFIKVKNLTEDQAKVIKEIKENQINNDVYILNDWTGEVFKDFHQYNDPETPEIKFIINKNEFPNTKSINFNFKKNIFGSFRVPVNYTLKIRKSLKKFQTDELPFHKFLTNDKSLIEKLKYAKFIAGLDETVLILGKTGTGKELLAEGIHYASERSKGPFIPVNCSAIPDSLFESEMFGYSKGAFTGADYDKKGYFESANGGTLFLDEIGDLPPTHQAKVLRVLQNKKFKRLGDEKEIKTDFRLVCATNKDITEREFRSDLYYRIANLTIQLPLLKDRDKSDIELLVSHFKDSIKTKYQKYFSIEYSKKAIENLSNCFWSGNVRQLQSFVYETFFWTAFKVKPKYAEKPIKNLDPKEPVYNTYESVIMGEPNYQDEEPLYEEKPIIIDDDFVNQFIEAQKIKEAKNKYLDSDIYSKIIDENITARDLPSNFNINAVIDEIKINYIKKLIKADMNQKDIGKKFGVKQQTVSTWLRDYGIK